MGTYTEMDAEGRLKVFIDSEGGWVEDAMDQAAYLNSLPKETEVCMSIGKLPPLRAAVIASSLQHAQGVDVIMVDDLNEGKVAIAAESFAGMQKLMLDLDAIKAEQDARDEQLNKFVYKATVEYDAYIGKRFDANGNPLRKIKHHNRPYPTNTTKKKKQARNARRNNR